MENKNMRKLNVTVQCMAVYNSSIMVHTVNQQWESQFLWTTHRLDLYEKLMPTW